MNIIRHTFLTLVALFLTAATALAQSYNINQGSITFSKVGDDLHVLQGATDDTYVFNNGTFPNITVYGNSTVTDNTILIDTPWTSSGYETIITLSNVLIQSTSAIPLELTYFSPVDLFLAAGTSNELKTTKDACPGIKVTNSTGGIGRLNVKGSGKLVAAGGESCAGIGGDFYGGGGQINIQENVTVIAAGGMGGAGIGGGEAKAGGNITISSNAVVIAKGGNGGTNIYGDTLGGAAGIGGGGPSSFTDYVGGAGGTITISGNANVLAQGGEFAAGIGGGEAGFPGTLSIGPSNKVVAVSDGTRSAIDDDGGTLDGNGYVLHATYFTPKTAGTTTSIKHYVYTTRWTWVTLASATPSMDYKSIAFSLPKTNTYLVYCNAAQQEHKTERTFKILTTGIKFFSDLANINKVIVTFDKNGGLGGSDQVEATYNASMPFAIGPTNSNTYLSFDGYFLDDGATKYYHANMSSARTCNIQADFTLYAKWIDGRVWDGVSRTYDWYTNQASPYTLSTPAQLAGLAAIVNNTASGIARDTFSNKIVNVASDFDLADFNWIPVGDCSANSANVFKGTFNGGAKAITGLKITTNTNYQALFGCISSSATLSNLTVSASITASNYVGGIAGYSDGGKIEGCSATGTIRGTNYVGGIAGASSGIIRNCSSSATIEADDWVGGIAGNLSTAGSLQNCTCTGTVKGLRSNTHAGGILGGNSGTAQNCIFSSNVTALGSSAWIGGIAGLNSGRVQNAILLGSLSFGTSLRVGGIVGENISAASVTNGYFLTASGVSKAIGTAAGTYASLGSFSNTVGTLTATDTTALLYGTQLHSALNGWVNSNNGAGTLLWWTTDLASYPSLTTSARPPFTLTTPYPVPFTWLATYYPGEPESNYETLANSVGTNRVDVWESYVAGLVPTNSTSTFTASITLTNGTPFITWSPDYPDRVYTIQGKDQLSHPSWGPTNSSSRFFNVNVEKP